MKEEWQRTDSPPLAADGRPRLPYVAYDEHGYAYDDDEPLALNQHQMDQFFYAFPVLQAFVGRRFPGAYAASDMFVYPLRGSTGIAPDIFIAFGAGARDRQGRRRNSYKLFEGEPVPSFVMELLSGTSADEELVSKRIAYAAWGVAEYWMFDPFRKTVPGGISAERLEDGVFRPIAPLPGTRIYPSAVLGVEMRVVQGRRVVRGRRVGEGDNLRIHDPQAGKDLLGYEETVRACKAEEKRLAAAHERIAQERSRRAELERQIAAEVAMQKKLKAEIAELHAQRNALS